MVRGIMQNTPLPSTSADKHNLSVMFRIASSRYFWRFKNVVGVAFAVRKCKAASTIIIKIKKFNYCFVFEIADKHDHAKLLVGYCALKFVT